MRNKIQQSKLEHLFAENFSSSVFPILADLYYHKKDYNKAFKVCQIGLKNDPENLLGQYILSKIMIVNEKFLEAEKLLQTVIIKDENNLNALLLLLELSISLKRKQATIQKYCFKLSQNIPKNKKVNKLKQKLMQTAPSISKKTIQKKKTSNLKLSSLQINDNMATKTMYQIIKKQRRFLIAKNILQIMINKKRNVTFAKNELKKINSIIDKEKN